jgi:hypothetical protein
MKIIIPVCFKFDLAVDNRGVFFPCNFFLPVNISIRYSVSDRRLSTKLVPTFADRGCHVVSMGDAYGHIFDVLDRGCHFSFQVAPQLYSQG